jgi:hypothetical protein
VLKLGLFLGRQCNSFWEIDFHGTGVGLLVQDKACLFHRLVHDDSCLFLKDSVCDDRDSLLLASVTIRILSVIDSFDDASVDSRVPDLTRLDSQSTLLLCLNEVDNLSRSTLFGFCPSFCGCRL